MGKTQSKGVIINNSDSLSANLFSFVITFALPLGQKKGKDKQILKEIVLCDFENTLRYVLLE